MPEPDVAIYRVDAGRYRNHHPTAADVIALIEVSRSRMSFDRGTKVRAYARVGIPEYWIVNVADENVEIYRSANDIWYAERSVHDRSGNISLLALPALVIPVNALLLLDLTLAALKLEPAVVEATLA